MIPDDIKKIAEEVLLEKNRLGLIGVGLQDEGGDVFYAWQKYREGINLSYYLHVFINGKDKSFVVAKSNEADYEKLRRYYDAGIRTILNVNKRLRRYTKLPIIKDDKERIKFAEELSKKMVDLFPDDVRYRYMHDEERSMIKYATILLLSSNERENLASVMTCFQSPKFVKCYLRFVTDADTYNYWTSFVPGFMQSKHSNTVLWHFIEEFSLSVGEDEIQDFCRKAREAE